jgi:hypothetical protein
MLAPRSRCSFCSWRTPRWGGSYTSRGQTHDGCDTRSCSSGWSLWYPARSAYIPLPKCRCGDSGRAATECHCHYRHQASATTQCCRDPAWRGSATAVGCGFSTGRQGATGCRWFPGVVPWLRGPPGCNGISASLRSTWHRSLQQRHLWWASDPYRGSTASSISPCPRSTMPPDDWPHGSAVHSTTWRSNSCTPHEDHAGTRAVVPHRSRRCTERCHGFYCEGSENGRQAHPWWSGWWSGWQVHLVAATSSTPRSSRRRGWNRKVTGFGNWKATRVEVEGDEGWSWWRGLKLKATRDEVGDKDWSWSRRRGLKVEEGTSAM